ncbi:MAG: YdiU family protein, partial [Proteobacteria bacterium]|nr:YdiU family protein [Pseudomonadota bacterium]
MDFDNSFRRLHPDFYTPVQPQGLHNARLVSVNSPLADQLGLGAALNGSHSPLVDAFSGNAVLPGSQPLAMAYSGHQFGVYNPQLGDGRGLLLGEMVVLDEQGDTERWDLHLKGAGTTPYSRMGDGRAVLRSSIREYLGSEAVYGLGIPSTRALCVLTSDTPVYRETEERGATLLRVARSHVRFGSFEFFHYTGRPERVKELADYVITRHYPQFADEDNKVELLLRETVQRTAQLVAGWQAQGFAHGVLNSDNMSILGDTFDFGPFAFIDDYQPGFICNHSDHAGRYAFDQQPSIGLWNCHALAQALTSLIQEEKVEAALELYRPALVDGYSALMRQKLGLCTELDEGQAVVHQLLALLT